MLYFMCYINVVKHLIIKMYKLFLQIDFYTINLLFQTPKMLNIIITIDMP